MSDDYTLSGKFSAEYLTHLFECLKKHGSNGAHFKFSQDGVELLDVYYDHEELDLFKIKFLKQITENELDLLLKMRAFNKINISDREDAHQIVTTDNPKKIAQTIIPAPNMILNSDVAFELDYECAKDAFYKTCRRSQFVFCPILNMILLPLWVLYEFIIYVFFADGLSLSLSHFDRVESVLLALSCLSFWLLRVNKNHIPIFREGSPRDFILHRTLTEALMKVTVIFTVLSFFT